MRISWNRPQPPQQILFSISSSNWQLLRHWTKKNCTGKIITSWRLTAPCQGKQQDIKTEYLEYSVRYFYSTLKGGLAMCLLYLGFGDSLNKMERMRWRGFWAKWLRGKTIFFLLVFVSFDGLIKVGRTDFFAIILDVLTQLEKRELTQDMFQLRSKLNIGWFYTRNFDQQILCDYIGPQYTDQENVINNAS